jgi:hypothetical protein
MAHALTFEELQQSVALLPDQQQMQLLAQLSARLSKLPFGLTIPSESGNNQKKAAEIDAWLAECDRVADLWQGKFDAAADLRRIRNED